MNTEGSICTKRGDYKKDNDRTYSETLRWLLINYKKKTGTRWEDIAAATRINRSTLACFRLKHNGEGSTLTFENGMRLMNYLKTKEGFDGGFINEPVTTSV